MLTKGIRRCVSWLCWLFFAFVVLCAAGEAYLRLSGYMPSEFDSDAVLGWTGTSGDHRSEEDPSVMEYVWANGQRRSRANQHERRPKRVAVFGDSYTYGAGVRDECTFCWKLHELCPEATFDNYAVGGYGPYQCYLSICDILKREKYDLIIYCVWNGSLLRNIHQSGQNRPDFYLTPWVELRNGQLVEHSPDVLPTWARHIYLFSFIKRVQMGISAYNSPIDTGKSDEYRRQVFTALLKRIAAETERYQIPLLLCLLSKDKDYYIKDGEKLNAVIADVSLSEFEDP